MPAKAPPLLQSAEAKLIALGGQLRARRKSLDITATAAAESAGISRVTWYRLEKGEPSVAVAAYANAAQVLGLDWKLFESTDGDAREVTTHEGRVPVRVRVADYPQLRKLAWQAHGTDVLTPREALSIYERNARHFEESDLTQDERALVKALRTLFAGDV